MGVVYEYNEFKIVTFRRGNRKEYIVINSKKSDRLGYKKSHTHIKSLKKGKELIDLVSKRKINTSLSIYLLRSLERLSEDELYQRKVLDLIVVKKDRGTYGYRNRPVGLLS